MRNLLLASLPVAALATSGCMQELQYVEPHAHDAWSTGGGGDAYVGQDALQFSGRGSLSGDIGPVKGFQRESAVEIDGYDDGVCTYITIRGVGDNGNGTMVVDLMPRAEQLPEGNTGVGYSETGEISTVTTESTTNGGATFYGSATDGAVIMTRLADGSRQLEVHALVDDGNGERTEAVGEFRLVLER
ncbi:MAG: hypothetical protein IT383_24270 [Deltaproteobacteria bacterium]|nr:hypothetical protein [Deltaproteobacteria bacterium]